MNFLLEPLYAVVSAPYFLQSMGMTTATAMVIGVLLYNGELRRVLKALLSISFYAFFIISTTLLRIEGSIGFKNLVGQESMTLASTMTVIIITFFYALGLFIGVYFKYMQKKLRKV